jgi:endonuclease VIII
MKIGQFLIEQKYFSGVGNYVRSEVLYEAKISPFRHIKDLTQLEKKDIFKHLNKVLHKAYQLLLKKQQHYPLKVYRQKITPKGEKVISERLEKNRNIYYVPEVQK